MKVYLARWGRTSFGEVRAESEDDALAQVVEELGDAERARRLRESSHEGDVVVQGRVVRVECVSEWL